MKDEHNNASKNKWSRIFKKKWFLPAMYLTIAALLLTVVVWYQNLDNQIPDGLDDQEMADDYAPNPYDEDAESVLEQQEVIKMPVTDKEQAEIVTKFYDYNAEQEDQENGLVLYNNRYYQSTGIDITSADGETFDVIASLSGTVTEVKEDPLLGNVVVMSHENDVMTYYASLGEVDVKVDSKVKQGEKLGTAGKNLFSQDSGTHVHFEIRKDGEEVNPEVFFNQPFSKLDSVVSENTDKESEATEEEAETEDGSEEPAPDEVEEDSAPTDDGSESSAASASA